MAMAGFYRGSGLASPMASHDQNTSPTQSMRTTQRPPVGAEAMLQVRSVCASSAGDDFNSWRQAEQAQRVHGHRALVEHYQGFIT
jgi:hypothetical protein